MAAGIAVEAKAVRLDIDVDAFGNQSLHRSNLSNVGGASKCGRWSVTSLLHAAPGVYLSSRARQRGARPDASPSSVFIESDGR